MRSEALLKKYENYLPKKDGKVDAAGSGNKQDPFTSLMTNMLSQVEELLEKADEVKNENNRATVATLNAEIRRGKNHLRSELPKLRKAAQKKTKGLAYEEKATREDLIDKLEYKIECVPDGVTRSVPPPKSKGKGPAHTAIDVSALEGGMKDNPMYSMEHSDASRAFRQEFEEAKARQDEGLDEISKGLNVLKHLGGEMGEELARQQPLVDVIDNKLDNVNLEVRTANGKLKHVITNLRSTRHMCIDVILICIILGIGLYLYNTLTK